MRPTVPHLSATAKSAVHSAATAATADWRSTLARSGLVAKGVLYASLGVLAINVAAGEAGTQTATRRGAIELVASQPLGQWLLGLLTLGLFALAVWQVILAITGDPVEGSETKDQIKYAGKAVIYFGTASTALSTLLAHIGSRATIGRGGGSSEDEAAATVMSWPGGPWLVGILGLAVVAFGIYELYKQTVTKAFMRRLARGQMDPRVERGVERAGRVGYAARAIVLMIVGFFFVVAAVQHDPREAVGLSGALAALSAQPWGEAVLWLVAVGLFLYGCFCFAEAKYRRAT
jgi:hypothetical protein